MALTDQQTTLIHNLARDISNADTKVFHQVETMVKSPPSLTTEALGFYPRGDESEFERVLRATIFTLSEKYLHCFEDKYINEALSDLVERNIIRKDWISGQAYEVIDNLANGNCDNISAMQLNSTLAEIETALSQMGNALCSFDLSGGDTMYFFILSKEKGGHWCNVELTSPGDPLSLSVRSADWELFIASLSYATGCFKDHALPVGLKRKSLRKLF